MSRKTLITYALVLLVGLASGLALPRLVAATRAWAGGCMAGLCYVQTTNPKTVLVWIDDSKVAVKKLKSTRENSYTIYFKTQDR